MNNLIPTNTFAGHANITTTERYDKRRKNLDKSAIKSNLGLGVLPKQMIEQELRKKEVVLIKEKKAPLINRVLCGQLNEKIPSKLEKLFVQFCQNAKI